MNNNKVAFITCVNDEQLHERCRQYIDALKVPDGFSIEIHVIRGASGMTSAYNQAMQESDAKYKVYLHQDTFIYNREFISDFLKLFIAYPKIGMLGVVGATRLPKTGIWFEDGLHSFGKVWEYRTPGVKLPFMGSWNQRRIRLVRFRPARPPFLPVLVIDGLVMITQYDIPWRIDLYDSFLYYEGPQSLEYYRKGYLVAIPYQKTPWCMHWGPEVDRNPEQHQKMWESIRKNAAVFTREYQEFIGKNVKCFLNKE